MRLRRFINEARVTSIDDKPKEIEDLDELTPDQNDEAAWVGKLIKENCKQWLKESEGKLCWRGYSKASGKQGWSERHTREDRYPKDTPQDVHDALNNEFEASFGWPARNGIFCSGDPAFAEAYGQLISIWPTDGYEYVWSSSIRDLFTTLDDTHSEPDDEYWEEEWKDEYGEPESWDQGGRGEWMYNGSYMGTDIKSDAIGEALDQDVWGEWKKQNEDKIEAAEAWRATVDLGETIGADEMKAQWDDEYPHDDIEDFDVEENEDDIRTRLYDEIANDEWGDFEWEPEIDYDTYYEDRVEDWRETYEPDVEGMTSDYQDDDLPSALDSENEIMIGPAGAHKYYAVDLDLTSMVWEYAYGFLGSDDKKQMKFDFAFHPDPKIDKGIWKNNRFFAGIYNYKTDAIEYIITFRELAKNKKAWGSTKPYHSWAGAWQAPTLNEYKWIPREQLKRFKDGASTAFFIPSNAKGNWSSLKFHYGYKFKLQDEQELARRISLHVKLAT